ncbi:MAG: YraN family protein [Rhodanobacter sp.]|nr:MAG: YraN family protein [Rhodanobacter sp.]TAL99454.1 MAG: YraN family protein [Rhodanobacter sp.]TAM41843.1 MAG: YraN family protein [Rhodanobacter sp.]TAN29018.1 MAG: YraN family protein [Rhodanobacter sp.]
MRAAGDSFEQRACGELERAGLTLLARNYATRYGELDLVMRDGDTVVFIEVRYRKSASHGDAAASVTQAKQARLILAAKHWLGAHPRHARHPCRFDVVSYDGPSDAFQRQWLRGAFEAG